MRRTITLSTSSHIPRFKSLPLWQRLLSWIIPFRQAYVVVHDGMRAYTHPSNLRDVKKILEQHYDVRLVATLTSVDKK